MSHEHKPQKGHEHGLIGPGHTARIEWPEPDYYDEVRIPGRRSWRKGFRRGEDRVVQMPGWHRSSLRAAIRCEPEG